MKATEIKRLFAELKFELDARRPPNDRRRIQFRAGWEDASLRHTNYTEPTLTRLTWRNLGYRFAHVD